jgi:hypothetical protein
MDLSNLLAKDNPKDLVIQLGHTSKYHEKLLIQKRGEWASDLWGLEENL